MVILGVPKIVNNEAVGSEAKKLVQDAQTMLNEIAASGTMWVKGVVGLSRLIAVPDGEAVKIIKIVGKGQEDGKILATCCMLHHQAAKESGDP